MPVLPVPVALLPIEVEDWVEPLAPVWLPLDELLLSGVELLGAVEVVAPVVPPLPLLLLPSDRCEMVVKDELLASAPPSPFLFALPPLLPQPTIAEHAATDADMPSAAPRTALIALTRLCRCILASVPKKPHAYAATDPQGMEAIATPFSPLPPSVAAVDQFVPVSDAW